MEISFESLFHLVKDIVVKETHAHPDEVQLHTRIEDDLGITGDDAWELMETFKSRFKIDMAACDHNKHYDSEGWGCILFWWCLGQAREYEPVTVEHLVRVAQEGRWLNPPLISKNTSG